MELYQHHTREIDKLRAKEILNMERTLIQLYDNEVVRQEKEQGINNLYDLLRDEKEIIGMLEEKMECFGWIED